MNDHPFNWGLIGCGNIAPRFFQAMEKTGEGKVVAAASKSIFRAKRFQQKTGVQKVYTSYEAMLDNEKLDAVYIATTHNFHAENARLCLNNKIPALVEKAFTQNAEQATELISCGRNNNTFLMEAMWTRFNPASEKLRQLLADNAIGDVHSLDAEFLVRMNPLSPKMMPWNRMFSRKLAGGALLDLGIYPISFARMVFGQPPFAISSESSMTITGVDAGFECRFAYQDKKTADFKCSFLKAGSRNMRIEGTGGTIEIPTFYKADKLIHKRSGMPEEIIQCADPGFEYQIREVHRCLREGLTESPLMPLDESLETMKTLDTLRSQWDMKYPGE